MTHAATARLAGFAPLGAPSRGPLARLLAAMALGRSRRCLAGLDDHLLADLGLSRDQALREAGRPSWGEGWDAPAHWLR